MMFKDKNTIYLSNIQSKSSLNSMNLDYSRKSHLILTFRKKDKGRAPQTPARGPDPAREELNPARGHLQGQGQDSANFGLRARSSLRRGLNRPAGQIQPAKRLKPARGPIQPFQPDNSFINQPFFLYAKIMFIFPLFIDKIFDPT